MNRIARKAVFALLACCPGVAIAGATILFRSKVGEDGQLVDWVTYGTVLIATFGCAVTTMRGLPAIWRAWVLAPDGSPSRRLLARGDTL